MTNTDQVVARYHQWTVGDRLRAARESVTLDGKQFAELIGISRDSLRSYERGDTQPKPPVLAAWCLATGFDKEWILTGEVPNGPETGEVVSASLTLRKHPDNWAREVDGIKPRSLLKLVA